MSDAVNKPAHYQIGGVETIDVIRAKLGPGFGYYCEGNAIKYLTRWRKKGGLEDLCKCQVYLGWLIEAVSEAPPEPKVTESDLPLHAFADSDDNAGSLNNGVALNLPDPFTGD